jgi:phenylpyruvate tautomerase PptA (4-oxalocrotonate tautomerase family)
MQRMTKYRLSARERLTIIAPAGHVFSMRTLHYERKRNEQQASSAGSLEAMPLVRISLLRGKPAGFGEDVGRIVYEVMVETIGVPQGDRFQLITEHDRSGLVVDPGYLGIARGDGIVVIQATISEGRSVEQKKALYRRIAERLNAELGVRIEDVFINLVEVKKENWSFGNGIAQYVS